MKDRSAYLFINQEHATKQMIFRLENYKDKKCCVVAVSNNAVTMAKELVRKLNADLFFIPSITMRDPAGSPNSIGVVSFDYVITYNVCRDIPQNFIYRHALTLQSELFSRYPGLDTPVLSEFQNRVVILVDDLVENSEKMLGLLEAIQRQQPQEIVVAIPVIMRDAAHRIMEEDVPTLFIHKVLEHSMDMAYHNFIPLTDGEVIWLLRSEIGEVIENKTPFSKTSAVKKVGRSSLNYPEPVMPGLKKINKGLARSPINVE